MYYKITARYVNKPLNKKSFLSKESYNYYIDQSCYDKIKNSEAFYIYYNGPEYDKPISQWSIVLPEWYLGCTNHIIITNIEKVSEEKVIPDRKRSLTKTSNDYTYHEESEINKALEFHACVGDCIMYANRFSFIYSDIIEMKEEQKILTNTGYTTSNTATINNNILTTTSDTTTTAIPNNLTGTAVSSSDNWLWINKEELAEMISDYRKNKEKDNMNVKSIIRDFNFGKVNDVKMSMYGPAFQSMVDQGDWIALEKKTGDWVNVSALLFDIDIPFYQMPVAKDAVKIGDFIRHNGIWVRIIDFDENTAYPIVEDVHNKEVKTIIPTKSPFGFDFYTKLVNIMGDMSFNTSKDQPFGNMLPFLLMSDKNKMSDILPMLMFINGGNLDMSNPMTILALCGENKMNDMLPLMLMMKSK